MINLEIEKSLNITPQETYDIISKAVDLANDEGFINQYVFERSLYVAAMAVFNEDERDMIADELAAGASPLVIWHGLLVDGKIDAMVEKYQSEIEYIQEQASIWYDDYVTYAASPRGMIDSLDALMTAFTGDMTSQVEALQNSDKITEAIEVANKWGMNNSLGLEESLFEG